MATLTDVEIPGIGKGIGHPKLKHKWRVTFSNIGTNANSQGLSLQAINVTRPSLSFEEVQLNRYNSRAFVAGKHEWQTMNLVVEDDISGSASTVIQEQLEKQQKLIAPQPGPFLQSGATGADYKFILVMDLLDGGDGVIEKWTCEGCFFQNVEWGDLDYGTSEAIQITLTVRYDHAFQEIIGRAGQAFPVGQ